MRKGLAAAGLILAIARVGAVDYLTAGADSQRTGWVKGEEVFTPANVSRMKLLWKKKLPSTPRHALVVDADISKRLRDEGDVRQRRIETRSRLDVAMDARAACADRRQRSGVRGF
jgi:hypothetical protein